MDFPKRNWWKLLPFSLFLLRLEGIIAFAALLITYSAYRWLPGNRKRGKLLTWLMITQTVLIVLLAKETITEPSDHLYWYWLVIITLEVVCLVGIWK